MAHLAWTVRSRPKSWDLWAVDIMIRTAITKDLPTHPTMVPSPVHCKRVLTIIANLTYFIRHPQRIFHQRVELILFALSRGLPHSFFIILRVNIYRHLWIKPIRIRKWAHPTLRVLLDFESPSFLLCLLKHRIKRVPESKKLYYTLLLLTEAYSELLCYSYKDVCRTNTLQKLCLGVQVVFMFRGHLPGLPIAKHLAFANFPWLT